MTLTALSLAPTPLTAGGPVAVSQRMKEVLTAADDVASTPTTVLLLGESGTGKEVIARHIHARSRRARGPWVAVNCAALPGELLENELFGHERGAFTGASERRCGRIEQAHGGTLLLDEVSELPLHLQSKLLRVIQEREVDRVGGQRPVAVDVRIIATSNRDLATMVQQKLFRADLYYRLNVFPIELPPLRDRGEDVPALAARLLAETASSLERRTPRLTASALDALRAYPFPGNVRELGNVLERALVRCRSEAIDAAHLSLPMAPLQADAASSSAVGHRLPAGLPIDLAQLEKLAIAEALHRVNGNRTHAARLLGIGLRTLRNKLKLSRDQPLFAKEEDGECAVVPGPTHSLRAFHSQLSDAGAARASQEGEA